MIRRHTHPTAQVKARLTHCLASGPLAAAAALATALAVHPAQAKVIAFDYTGTAQTWVAPAGVRSDNIVALGAQGGSGYWSGGSTAPGNPNVGGLGGQASGTLAVGAGQTLSVLVGGRGRAALDSSVGVQATDGRGGFNGGGDGGLSIPAAFNRLGRDIAGAGGGGGASDVRLGGSRLTNRVIVAGGGGGSGGDNIVARMGVGGGGGYYGGGAAGVSGPLRDVLGVPGGGGTPTAGGAGAASWAGARDGAAGGLGQGGAGGGRTNDVTDISNLPDGSVAGVGGAGGGLTGGTGDASTNNYRGSGGGGSSFISSIVTGGNTLPGLRAGNGLVTFECFVAQLGGTPAGGGVIDFGSTALDGSVLSGFGFSAENIGEATSALTLAGITGLGNGFSPQSGDASLSLLSDGAAGSGDLPRSSSSSTPPAWLPPPTPAISCSTAMPVTWATR